MSLPLISTKFFIPPVRAGGIARPHLTARIMDAVKLPGRLVLLSCPPGFGKTCLLSEFVRACTISAAWVSLDEGDNDPIRFWTSLVSAIRTLHPMLGEAPLSLLQIPQPLPPEAVPSLLINELANLPEELILVLDDYHLVQESSIHAALAFLIEHLPERLHIVIATRMDPPWPLARLRARNQLTELRAADLRFNAQETLAFLRDTMSLDLSPAQVAALDSRTEGWAASLQLAAISMQASQDIEAFVRAFTGSHTHLAEYLVEEVLKTQPEPLQTFLLQTSILERLNAEICQAVTGLPEARELLSTLQRKNLFLVPLDEGGNWFRYHHLFADLLRARLGQSSPAEDIRELNLRAARWYEAAGMESEAISHALAAGDSVYAVEMVGKIAMPMLMKAHFKTVEGWLSCLPSGVVKNNPRLHLTAAWLHLLRRDPSRAESHLGFLRAYFSSPESDSFNAALQGEWLALQSALLGAQGQPAESRRLALQSLKILPEEQAHIRSLTYNGLAGACQQLYDYEGAASAYHAILQQGQASGDFASEIFGLSCLGLMMLQQGKLHSAFEIASQALQRIEARGAFSPFTATLYGELASIDYHWHRLEQARGSFSRSVQLSLPGGFNDAELYHHVFLSRLFQMEGDLQAALQEIEKALEGLPMAVPAFVSEEVLSQQVCVLLALGRLPEAQAALKPAGFEFEPVFSFPALAPEAGIPHSMGLLYNSALRILLSRAGQRGDPHILQDGIRLTHVLLAGTLRAHHLPITLQTLLLRARMYARLGDQRSSRADLLRALEMAAPEGFISLFLEEGPSLAAMLSPLKPEALHAGIPADYLSVLLDTFGTDESAAHGSARAPGETGGGRLIERLTAREMEVLRLIASGDSNRDIAEKLVVTLSAVKKHTGSIFRKLGVNSRTQALARARDLHLPGID